MATDRELALPTSNEIIGFVDPLIGRIALRDSKDTSLPPHHFTPTEWNAFLAGVRGGEFDLPPMS